MYPPPHTHTPTPTPPPTPPDSQSQTLDQITSTVDICNHVKTADFNGVDIPDTNWQGPKVAQGWDKYHSTNLLTGDTGITWLLHWKCILFGFQSLSVIFLLLSNCDIIPLFSCFSSTISDIFQNAFCCLITLNRTKVNIQFLAKLGEHIQSLRSTPRCFDLDPVVSAGQTRS